MEENDSTKEPRNLIKKQLDCKSSLNGEKKASPPVLPNSMSLKVVPHEEKDPPQVPKVVQIPDKDAQHKETPQFDSNKTKEEKIVIPSQPPQVIKKTSVPKKKAEVVQRIEGMELGVAELPQKSAAVAKTPDSSLPPTGQVGGMRGLKVDQARSDLTFRTYGPKPYTKKETFQTPIAPIDKESFSNTSMKESSITSIKDVPLVYKDPEVRFHEGFQSPECVSYSPKKDLDVNKLPPKTSDFNTPSAINTPSAATPGQIKAKTGVLAGVPFMSKTSVDQPLAKTKKHSTFSLQSSEDMSGPEQVAAPDDGLLQRRNSIHNVPYVDVNDPATRERMERYKEERRSMLRSKFRVEDYREKAPAGKKK